MKKKNKTEEDNYLLLNNWLYKVITDNPELIKKFSSTETFYYELHEIFLKDIQKSMKGIIKEVSILKDNP